MKQFANNLLSILKMANIDYSDVHGIIFDYGGTIDSRGDHWSEVIWQAYLHAGIRVDKGFFRDAYVYAERALATTRHILPTHDFLDLLRIKMRLELQWLVERDLLPSEQLDALAENVARLCDAAARDSIRQARPVLDELRRRGYSMVLVSNFYGNVTRVLESYDLLQYFPDIIESAVVGIRKPDPRIFVLGVEALGLPASQVLVVGDSLRKDIIPAESLGCQTAWVKGKGWTAEEDAQTHPSIISSLDALLQLLPEKCPV